MDARQFFTLVSRMRQAQKQYFKTRNNNDLRTSKQLEKEIDAEIKRINEILQRKRTLNCFSLGDNLLKKGCPFFY